MPRSVDGRRWARLGVAALAHAAALLSACSRRGNETGATAGAPRFAALPPSTGADSAGTQGAGGEPVVPTAPLPEPSCGDAGSAVLFVSPERPVQGQPLRVVAVVDRRVDARLTIESPARGSAAATRDRTHAGGGASGEVALGGDAASPRVPSSSGNAVFAVLETATQGGPPYAWITQVDGPAAGSWRLQLARSTECGGAVLATKDVTVARYPLAVSTPPRTALWPTRRAWSAGLENLYSAWIEHLFDAPLETQPSWAALHDVLRDGARNFLLNHLGAAEDEQGVVIRPDCADLPYFLRAYFSFKLGLPFGWSRCTRGGDGEPPRCKDFATNEDPFPAIDGEPQTLPPWADPARKPSGPWENNAKRLGELFRTTLADAVQSGAGRTPPEAEESDYYPLSISVDTLRPGTIFADPYGHVLVVSSRIPENSSASGVLLAVDGQPDGTVARKRFWRGNFLFAIDPSLGGAGFKRFRPVVRDRTSGRLVHARNSDLPDYSATDQYSGGVEGFYDKIEDVLSPVPSSPMQALLEALQALEEQVTTRVRSIDGGRRFLGGAPPVVEMPEREKIFETTGQWEDFSTPSRDLRLLIAIDVVRALPARVVRRPERYLFPKSEPVDRVRQDLEDRLGRELRDRKFEYVRSDGSAWQLSLQDVIDRQEALEMAYNPNDCVEARWGAPASSPEASTCKTHAPAGQVDRMAEYRPWFHERRRPPR